MTDFHRNRNTAFCHTTSDDWSEGYQAGKNGTLSANDITHPYEDKVKTEEAQACLSLHAEYACNHGKIKFEAQQLAKKKKYSEEKREKISSNYQEQLNFLEQMYGASSIIAHNLNHKLRDQQQLLFKLTSKLNRPLRTDLTHLYIPLLISLAISEVPLNRSAFELLFMEQPLMSTLLSVVIGSVLVFISHSLGKWICQSSYLNMKQKIVRYLTSLSIAFLAIPSFIYLIAKTRQIYIEISKVDQSTSLFDSTPDGILQTVMNAPLDIVGYTLFGINIAIFFVGVVASILRHDPHPDYEKLDYSVNKLTHKIHALQQLHIKDKIKLNNKHDMKLAEINKVMDSLDSKILYLHEQETSLCDSINKLNKVFCNRVIHRLSSFERGFTDAALQNSKNTSQVVLPSFRKLSFDEMKEFFEEFIKSDDCIIQYTY